MEMAFNFEKDELELKDVSLSDVDEFFSEASAEYVKAENEWLESGGRGIHPCFYML